MNDEELERDLRRVLSDPGHRLPDRLVPLERVHAGAAHRRRQRQAVTASLAVLAVVGIGLGVARPWASGDGSDVISGASITPPVSTTASVSPSHSEVSISPSSPSPSTSLSGPAGILANMREVTSVTALDDSHWWVAADIDGCNDCSSSVLSTKNDGTTFAVVTYGFDGALNGGVETLRFVDPTHATALMVDGSLETSSDGGRKWRPAVASAASFFALEAGGGKTTWALQHNNADDGIHLWVQAGSAAWKDVATLDETSTPGEQNVQLAVQGDHAVVVWRTSKAVVSASYAASGASAGTTTLTDCDYTLGLSTLSSGRNAIWLSCQTGTADTILTSQDDGATWHPVPVPGDAERHVVGAIDANHAVISMADGLGILGTDETLQDATLPTGVTSSDWTYIGFTNPTHGFAITGDGQLLRSTDGGRAWKAVRYTG